MTLGEWATPQWFVVGFPRPGFRLSPEWRWERLENWAYEYERSPYRPGHFRPTREGQGNHKGCPYGGVNQPCDVGAHSYLPSHFNLTTHSHHATTTSVAR